MRYLVSLTAAALLAAACSSVPSGNNPGYAEEYRQLSEQCSASGGVLVPLGTGTTGDPAADYACNRRDGLLN